MANAHKSIPELYNGISQQNPAIRLDSQCANQDNFLGNIVDGLTKRPGSEHVDELTGSNIDTSSFIHFYQRDITEKYLIAFTGDATDPIEVYDLADGSSKTVNYQDANAKSYASGATNLKAVTIADYTIVVDTDKVTAMDSATTSSQDPIAYVWAKNRVANISTRIKVSKTDDTHTDHKHECDVLKELLTL